MSLMGRALLLGRRRRRTGMLRIAVGQWRTARHPGLVGGLSDACRPQPDGCR